MVTCDLSNLSLFMVMWMPLSIIYSYGTLSVYSVQDMPLLRQKSKDKRGD